VYELVLAERGLLALGLFGLVTSSVFLALVILGGLATSTVLNLLVLPALALRFGRFVADPSN